MNVKATLLLCGIGIILLSSCKKDDGQPALDAAEICFASNVANVTRAVPDDQIASGQQIGVFVNEDAVTPTYTYTQNVIYTADGTGGFTTASTQFFPQNGNPVKIAAYHPYNAAGTSSFDFTVQSDQSSDVNFYASDLLYCPEQSYSRSQSPINLNFDHLLSKVTFELVSGDGAPDLSSATVSFVNIQPTVNFDPTTGSVTPVSAAPVTLTPNPNYGVIFAPQTIPGGTSFIKVTAEGKDYYSKAPVGGYTFTNGNSYKFTITVNKTSIVITTTEITIWGGIAGPTEVGTTHTYAIGDYYPDPNNRNTAIGIIFQITDGGLHGKMLSKTRLPGSDPQGRWAAENSIYETLPIGLLSTNDGMNNLNVLKRIPDWTTEFPAFNYWDNYLGGGWYIPSVIELKAVCAGYSGLNFGTDVFDWPQGQTMPNFDSQACIDARAAFDAKLTTKIGLVKYLSSTEHGDDRVFGVQLGDGSAEDYAKNSAISAYGTRGIKRF